MMQVRSGKLFLTRSGKSILIESNDDGYENILVGETDLKKGLKKLDRLV